MLHKLGNLSICLDLAQVEGNLIKWERWHIRTSFNYREGLVLHNVGYEDEGHLRPILHRASLVEMCVVSVHILFWRPPTRLSCTAIWRVRVDTW